VTALNENVIIAVKYCFAMLALLGIIFLMAVLTPKMALLIDKIIKKAEKNSKIMSFSDENDDIYKVRGAFDAHIPSSDKKKENNINNGDELNGKE
jgi:hypothetical protein